MDNILLSFGIFISLAFWALLVSLFGVEGVHFIYYFIIGFATTVYKLFKTNERKYNEMVASFLLGLIFIFVVAPILEIELKFKPYMTALGLSFLILTGEVGIYYMFKKVTGIELTITPDLPKPLKRQSNLKKKTVEIPEKMEKAEK
jgi:hypothetical protein